MIEDAWATLVHTPVAASDKQRISDDVEAFVRRGGAIKVCGPEDNALARFLPKRTREQVLAAMKRRNYIECWTGAVQPASSP